MATSGRLESQPISNVCRNDHLEAEAYCDTINGGGEWLVVQRIQDGTEDFNT